MALQQLKSNLAVFLDGTALQAFMDPENPHYTQARALFHDLDDLDRGFITTSWIIFAIHRWIRERSTREQAQFFLQVVEKAESKGRLMIVFGTPELEHEARHILQNGDLPLALPEAMTAVVMSAYGLDRIFTFNPDFLELEGRLPGLRIIPRSAIA